MFIALYKNMVFVRKIAKTVLTHKKTGIQNVQANVFSACKKNFIELFVNQNVRIGKCPQR